MGCGAYERCLEAQQHHTGKTNTQRIERKQLTLRTRIERLARKTMCFSKSEQMHDIAIKLYINRYEFGLQMRLAIINKCTHYPLGGPSQTAAESTDMEH
ncbi:hypothetical protein H6G02_09875 [Leptolyngbya sp. FACHB-16]|nr:hypothetical protein [Leptolyngbya sp. FACHB-16]